MASGLRAAGRIPAAEVSPSAHEAAETPYLDSTAMPYTCVQAREKSMKY